ncbi:MAG TPA: M28 family peptidase [Candidatus Angelobacter sp.]|nr:M28 family peptidase [Candidatus Angelobacter sp.]
MNLKAQLQKDATQAVRYGQLPVLGIAIPILFLLGLGAWLAEGPAALHSDASAADALKHTLTRIFEGEPAHPTGSSANADVRNRIVGMLQEIGYAPEVQSTLVCNAGGTCAEVHNILARLKGKKPGPYLMLAAHYDSVGSGPGISDDGSGVAILLEIARYFRWQNAPEKPILFFIDDGEELGLLGAKAFIEQNPLAREVGSVINLEARGTSGPSLMFETSAHNAGLIRLYARSVPHPVSNSLLYEIYRHLPNDTDFTVFKAHGITGYNLAFISNANYYHGPLDDLADISQASLEHQFSNTVALAHALGSCTSCDAKTDAVFFDLFGVYTVWWAAPVTWILLLLACGLLVASGLLLRPKASFQFRALFSVGLCWVVLPVSSLLLTVVYLRGLSNLGGSRLGWPPHPEPAVTGVIALGLALAAFLVHAVASKSELWRLLLANCTIYTLVSAVLALTRSGAVYLFLLSAILAGAALVAGARWSSGKFAAGAIVTTASLLPFVVLWVPVMHLLYMGLGTLSLFLIVPLISILAMPLFFLVPARRSMRPVLAGGVAVAVCAGIVQFAMPAQSMHDPALANLNYYLNAGSATARWQLQTNAEKVLGKALEPFQFRRAAEGVFPWQSGVDLAANAPVLSLPAPQFDILAQKQEGAQLQIRGKLRSLRRAAHMSIFFPRKSHIAYLRANGVEVPLVAAKREAANDHWQAYSFILAAGEVDLQFSIDGKQGDAYILDRTNDLPPQAQPMLSHLQFYAMPVQGGNITVVGQAVHWGRDK